MSAAAAALSFNNPGRKMAIAMEDESQSERERRKMAKVLAMIARAEQEKGRNPGPVEPSSSAQETLFAATATTTTIDAPKTKPQKRKASTGSKTKAQQQERGKKKNKKKKKTDEKKKPYSSASATAAPGINRRNMAGETRLLRAVMANNTDLVAELLAKGANPMLADNAGWTPLHDAGDAGIAKQLIAAGADVNAASAATGDTPLHEAARHGNAEGAELLLAAFADPRANNQAGQVPADLAEDAALKARLTNFVYVPPPTLTTPPPMSEEEEEGEEEEESMDEEEEKKKKTEVDLKKKKQKRQREKEKKKNKATAAAAAVVAAAKKKTAAVVKPKRAQTSAKMVKATAAAKSDTSSGRKSSSGSGGNGATTLTPAAATKTTNTTTTTKVFAAKAEISVDHVKASAAASNKIKIDPEKMKKSAVATDLDKPHNMARKAKNTGPLTALSSSSSATATASAPVIPKGPPSINRQPIDQVVRVGANVSAVFFCGAAGAEPLTFAWYQDGRPLKDGEGLAGGWDTVSGSQRSTLIVRKLRSDAWKKREPGRFMAGSALTCEVRNSRGRVVSRPARLKCTESLPEMHFLLVRHRAEAAAWAKNHGVPPPPGLPPPPRGEAATRTPTDADRAMVARVREGIERWRRQYASARHMPEHKQIRRHSGSSNGGGGGGGGGGGVSGGSHRPQLKQQPQQQQQQLQLQQQQQNGPPPPPPSSCYYCRRRYHIAQ
eukprot:UC1_evm1s1811